MPMLSGWSCGRASRSCWSVRRSTPCSGAFAAARLLTSVLYGGNALDPMTFTLVPLVLFAVAAVATFAPARRAALVDPAITLRAD